MRFKIVPSKIHGVGVIATANIRKGENLENDWLSIFLNMEDSKVIPNKEFAGFNHSCQANMTNKPELIAIKDIAEGEEVTLNYRNYIGASCNCGQCSK